MTDWADAMAAVAIHAVDPVGIVARGLAGPAREALLALLRAATPTRRLPAVLGDERLAPGLNLAATLVAGRPVTTPSVLEALGGATPIVPMAERLRPAVAAALGAHIDRGGAGAVALDEEGTMPASVADRLALHLDLADAVPDGGAADLAGIAAARASPASADGAVLDRLVSVAVALGVSSLRAPLLALRVARAAAALAGRAEIAEPDIALAARLVLAPRATRLPTVEDSSPKPGEAPPDPRPDDEEAGDAAARPPPDVVLAAALASVPPDVLARIAAPGGAGRPERRGRGAERARRAAQARGRPVGSRRGDPRTGRLALYATLLAAAPWQRARARGADAPARLRVEASDLRVVRARPRPRATLLFAVDASGSTAYQRLAEAKGAVEVILGRAYARRDQVGLIAFRGPGAMVLLPPTPALARGRRALAALPGGGGTPLAAGLDALLIQAMAVRRAGGAPMGVVLADGGANIARDGTPGRARAMEEARDAARRLRASGLPVLLIDTAPRPAEVARALAAEMGARYLALPLAGARALGRAVLDAATPSGR